MHNVNKAPMMAIACGGTGGHLFPGLAVAEHLVERGCEVTLLVSPKEVDQQVVKRISAMQVITLPAVGLKHGNQLAFVRGFTRSYSAAKKLFKSRCPQAALAMGGFTSAPPILAAKRCGAPTFLHESNTIPGRANRWLSWVVNRAFVGFPTAARALNNRDVLTTGTPVRPQFQRRDPAVCRKQLGLDPRRPVVAVMGGSQGASAINDLVIQSLPLLLKLEPDIQWFHLTGPHDGPKVQQAYDALKVSSVVRPFFDEMETLLGAATAAISRAGASSLAELAAMRLPAVLIPYPAATDNHQFHNARALAETGAARLLEQANGTPEALAQALLGLIEEGVVRENVQAALGRWHSPNAAEEIAETMLRAVSHRLLSAGPPDRHSPEPERAHA
jgi:UDP-N-acetylglucosamine--N-acetylmuramyl-(pentapeptide) pyrophosphoryl-undecaprenol N-acetylglucosamine transferase